MSMTPDQFFQQMAGSPSFKFDQPGATITGTITDLQVTQSRTYDPTGGPGEPKTWPSGDPQMQLNITLQTTLRDPAVEDDDGRRRVYVDGRRIRDAVKAAFTAVGAPGLEIGGEYTQTFTGYDPESKNPKNPAKLYAVRYARPNAAAGFFNGTQPAAEPAPAPVAQPAPAAQTAPAAASPAAPAVDQGALVAALGNLPPEVRAALLAGQTG